MHLFHCLFLLTFSCLSFNTFAHTVVIQGNERSDYFVDTLKQALSYSPNKKYQIKFYKKNLPKIRAFNNIATNGGINIIAAGATTDREKILLPIQFPIVKGLFGWRIPLVSNSNRNLFSAKLSDTAFKKLSVGQLRSWSDTKILTSNNLNVVKGSLYEGLFEMLVAGRFDYFPRSILEVQKEFDEHQGMNITIDKNILIHYPFAYFFYVNKKNTELADDVRSGLEQSLKDGSFERLFIRYYGDIIKQALSENRLVYQLKNPFLPKKTPLHRKELWLDLAVNEEVHL